MEKKIIKKKYEKLKILGKGDINQKIKITTDYVSKSARLKVEKVGGSINISKQKTI